MCVSEWTLHEHLIPSEDCILNPRGSADPKVRAWLSQQDHSINHWLIACWYRSTRSISLTSSYCSPLSPFHSGPNCPPGRFKCQLWTTIVINGAARITQKGWEFIWNERRYCLCMWHFYTADSIKWGFIYCIYICRLQRMASSILRRSIWVRKNFPKIRFYKKKRKRKILTNSNRGGIPLSGNTDMQSMLCAQTRPSDIIID